jgi:hypothetical protein
MTPVQRGRLAAMSAVVALLVATLITLAAGQHGGASHGLSHGGVHRNLAVLTAVQAPGSTDLFQLDATATSAALVLAAAALLFLGRRRAAARLTARPVPLRSGRGPPPGH